MTEQNSQNWQIDLPESKIVGVFADFASIWHTPNVFVIDFMSLRVPPSNGNIQASVASRVRVPAEQISLIIKALQEQLDAWVSESGRSSIPTTEWLNPNLGNDNPDAQ